MCELSLRSISASLSFPSASLWFSVHLLPLTLPRFFSSAFALTENTVWDERKTLERWMTLVPTGSFSGSHLRAVMEARLSLCLPGVSLSQDLVMHHQRLEETRRAVSQENSLLSVSIGPHLGGQWHTGGRPEIGYKITTIHSAVSCSPHPPLSQRTALALICSLLSCSLSLSELKS